MMIFGLAQLAPFMIGMFAFLLCAVVSRVVAERAFRSLSDEDKLMLMNAFSGMRAYSIVPLIFILAIVFGLPFLFPAFSRLVSAAGLGMVVIYVAAIHFVVWRRLNSLDLSADYKRQFLISRHLSHLGMLVLVACVIFGIWGI